MVACTGIDGLLVWGADHCSGAEDGGAQILQGVGLLVSATSGPKG